MQIGPANVFTPKRGGSDIQPLDDLILSRSPVTTRIRNAFFRAYNYFNKQPFSTYGSQTIPQWDGGEDRYGRRYTSCWAKVAALLRKHKITNVERFVLAQFASRTDKKLYPNMLLSKDVVNVYYAYDETADDSLKEALRTETETFAKAVAIQDGDDKARWRAVLCNNTYDISPLMRYIIASSERMDDVVRSVYNAAVLQVMLDPEGYLRTWGKVPAVKEILQDLIGGSYDTGIAEADAQHSGDAAGVHNPQ